MATYFVDKTTGSDADDGLSAPNAWQTLGKALLTIAPGDKVWVKNTESYTETMVISIVGTQTLPVVFEGYTTTVGDGGVAVVDGEGARTTGLTPDTGSNFYVFKGFQFKNHTLVGAGTLTGDYITYKKCRFNNNTTDGVNADQHCLFEGCYAHDNLQDGYDVGAFCAFIGCVSRANGVNGFSSEGGVYYRCISSSDAGDGFLTTLASYHVFIGCIVDGDAKDTNDGFDIANAFGQSDVVVVNCVAYDCGVGIRSNADLNSERVISRNNLVNSNTSPYTNFSTLTGEVTANPAFADEANANYGPAMVSPLRAAGFGPGTNGWITMTETTPAIGVSEVAGGNQPPLYPLSPWGA